MLVSVIANSVADSKFPVAVFGSTSSLINCLNAVEDDGKPFVPHRPFPPVVVMKCIQQAHRDIFDMIDIVTVVDYLMSRLRTALHEKRLGGHVVLRRCVRAGRMPFENLLARLRISCFCGSPFSILFVICSSAFCVDVMLTIVYCCSCLCDILFSVAFIMYVCFGREEMIG